MRSTVVVVHASVWQILFCRMMPSTYGILNWWTSPPTVYVSFPTWLSLLFFISCTKVVILSRTPDDFNAEELSFFWINFSSFFPTFFPPDHNPGMWTAGNAITPTAGAWEARDVNASWASWNISVYRQYHAHPGHSATLEARDASQRISSTRYVIILFVLFSKLY